MIRKEIGSNFELCPQTKIDTSAKFDINKLIQGSDSVLLSTGRSGISLVLDEIEYRRPDTIKKALIPSFTCDTVIEPFIQKGYEIYTYTVDSSLNVNTAQFRDLIKNTGARLVLVHRYFGFDTLPDFDDIICEFRTGGVIFIEDKTQSLYGDFPLLSADYFIGSLRKWDALPDGGYAVCKEGTFHKKPSEYDGELMEKKIKASKLKYEYLNSGIGEKKVFLDEFAEAEMLLSNQKQNYLISPMSEYIQSSMDVEFMKVARRKNYRYVYDRIKDILKILTPELSDSDVPLYLALSVDDRAGLQSHLRDNFIYAPVLWPKPSNHPDKNCTAEWIYDTVICLPIDQRYNLDDMKRMTDCIEEYIS